MKKKAKQMLPCFDNCVYEYQIPNMLSKYTSQTHVNNQSVWCIKFTAWKVSKYEQEKTLYLDAFHAVKLIVGLIPTLIQGINTLEETMQRPVIFLFYQAREKIIFCKKDLVYQRNLVI